MRLLEIGPQTKPRAFHDAARVLYAGDPNRIAPLDMEIEAIFDPRKNALFNGGEAVRWILQDDGGRPIGRIAAFVNLPKARLSSPVAGGAGFFECADDPAAANVLFDAARGWLARRGCEAMDASVNFGDNFVHWGVLVEGFTPQGYGMPYNKPYYGRLFESYGFQEYFRQFTYHFDIRKPLPARQLKFAEFLLTQPGLEFRHFEKKNPGPYIRDFVEVLNATWADYLENFQPVPVEDIERLFRSAKPLLIDDFLWFGYKDGKPVGILAAFPDLNQVLAKFDGRLPWWKVPRFLALKSGKTITRNRLLIAGIVPEAQNSGVISALFLKYYRAVASRPHYTEMELSWVGDYNPRMRKVYEMIGAVQKKVHATYRYLFDRDRPFVRFTNAGGHSGLRRDEPIKEIPT
jgi:hypothetical protein